MFEMFDLIKSLFNPDPKDAIIQSDWFKQKCKEADEQAIQNLREMLKK
jgi:hypothetical protein